MKRSYHPKSSTHEERGRQARRLMPKEAALSRIMPSEKGRRKLAAKMTDPIRGKCDPKKISTVKARSQFSDVVNRAAYGKETIILTRRGKEIAAVIPLEDLQVIEEREDRIDLAEARKAWKEQGKEPLIPWATAKKRLGLK